jgi:hypothetical protein
MKRNINLWTQLVMQQSPILSESAAELLYFRAATAWGHDQKLEIADGIGGWVDLTKLYEQFKLLSLLKENHTK